MMDVSSARKIKREIFKSQPHWTRLKPKRYPISVDERKKIVLDEALAGRERPRRGSISARTLNAYIHMDAAWKKRLHTLAPWWFPGLMKARRREFKELLW